MHYKQRTSKHYRGKDPRKEQVGQAVTHKKLGWCNATSRKKPPAMSKGITNIGTEKVQFNFREGHVFEDDCSPRLRDCSSRLRGPLQGEHYPAHTCWLESRAPIPTVPGHRRITNAHASAHAGPGEHMPGALSVQEISVGAAAGPWRRRHCPC